MELVQSTGVFETAHLPRLVPLLSEAGFRKLEIVDKDDFPDGMLEALVVLSKEHGVELPNWHLIQRSPFQPTASESRSAINRMKISMDQGARIGAKNHVLHWDNRFLDTGYNDTWRNIVDEWVDYAKALNIRLLMETVPDKPTNQRYVPCDEIVSFVRDYPSEHLSMCLDVNHSNLKEKLPDVVELLQDRLVSIHMSDNDGHSEKHWLPGLGVIPYEQLFDALESVGYEGSVVLEVNRWCAEPEDLSQLRLLNSFGRNLLERKKPHTLTFGPEYRKYAE